MSIGSQKLIQYRHDKGLSQTALAAILDTYQETVSSYESGRRIPRLDTAFEIYKLTGIEAWDWLI